MPVAQRDPKTKDIDLYPKRKETTGPAIVNRSPVAQFEPKGNSRAFRVAPRLSRGVTPKRRALALIPKMGFSRGETP